MDKYHLFYSVLFAFIFMGDLLSATDLHGENVYLTTFFFLGGLVCLLVSMYNMVKAVEPKGS